MTAIFSPAHVAALRSLKPCREIVTVRICAGRGRAHRHLIRFSRTNALNPARNQSVATSLLPSPGQRQLPRTTIEATHTPRPVVVRGPFCQARDFGRQNCKFSFLRAHASQQARRIFSILRIPRLSFLSVAHATNSSNGASICPANVFQKMEK